MTIRALIADDEPPARFRIRELLADAPDVAIVAETTSGRETLEAVRQHKPNLMFLDVQMPPPNGVALLRELALENRPCTIFTTAHDDHALDAFALRAIDYLLKPFTGERFHDALARAREFLATSSDKPARLRRLLARDGQSYTVVPVEEIKLIESANNYVVIHTLGKRVVIRRTMASLEEDLDPAHFIRVNRAAIVNLQFVRSIECVAVDEHVIVLEGGARVTLNRGVRELQARLERGSGRS